MGPSLLAGMLEEVRDTGASHRILAWEEFPSARRASEMLALTPAATRYGPSGTEQHFALASFMPADAPASLAALASRLVGEVHAGAQDPGRAVEMFSDWYPDELVVQRYRRGLGIDWHTDESKHARLLVAIFALYGRATFSVEGDVDRRVAERSFVPQPGSVVLFRGTDVVSGAAWGGRPRHRVDESGDGRTVAILRMNGPRGGSAQPS